MRKTNIILLSILTIFLMFSIAAAQDKEMTGEQQMPEMGPPEEIKALSHLVGTWDIAMSSKWNPEDTAWIPSTGTATFKYVCNGAAIMEDFDSEFQGTPFKGIMLQTYDRDTGMWQTAWTDDMGAKISFYQGKKTEGKTVVEGDDFYQGQTWRTRVTTFNEKPDSFQWMMEMSTDGGKTFVKVSEATYTKRK